jgi:uncharacterized protein (TIGR03083 family)
METDPHRWINALRASHDTLMAQVADLSTEQLDVESYCKGWDVGQVLSHIGSGAEIGLTTLERTLAGDEPLGRDDFPVIWGRWNGLNPNDKMRQMVIWDRRLVSVTQALDDATLSSIRIPFAGMDLDIAGVMGFRLSEHALHTWDVAVTFDPEAEVSGTSAALLVDRIGFMAGRTGKAEAAAAPRHIEVRTVRPERRLLLTIADKVTLSDEVDGPVDGTLELPAAALIRLTSGRLDPDHTPAGIKTEGSADLDELRLVFPGF